MKVTTQKVSQQVAAQLEKQIVEGVLTAGAKLASERDLAQQYGVSRPSIRDAIKQLEAKGLVTRKQGGGTFVCNELVDPFAEPLFELLANSPESHYDLLEFRFALEGVISYYAALRGSEQEFERIQQAFAQVEQQVENDLESLSEAVVDFYLAIADASHNVVLKHLLLGLKGLLKHNVQENLSVFQPYAEITKQLSIHRKELMDAIITQEPEKARQANRQHLAFIEKSLIKLDQDNNRIQGSVRRLLDSQ